VGEGSESDKRAGKGCPPRGEQKDKDRPVKRILDVKGDKISATLVEKGQEGAAEALARSQRIPWLGNKT